MSDTVAIDVALLPDGAGNELAIKLSESLPPDRPFILNRTDRLPHCSLFMAHVRSGDLSAISEQLSSVVVMTTSLSLTGELETYESPDRPILSGIKLERSAALQKLHKSIVASLRDLGGHQPTDRSYILDSTETEVRPLSIKWTVDYVTNSSFDRFHPHITLGQGVPTDESVRWPTVVHFDRLALCQLGNWNTCRKILAQWWLK